jgi:hypothetical protein
MAIPGDPAVGEGLVVIPTALGAVALDAEDGSVR